MKITREQLKNIVREVMTEESEYQTFFKKALEKTGKSIPQMSDDEKKAFFNKIDTAWKGKGEKTEGNAFGAAVAQAKKDGDDSFEVDGKKYKVEEESVNENNRFLNAFKDFFSKEEPTFKQMAKRYKKKADFIKWFVKSQAKMGVVFKNDGYGAYMMNRMGRIWDRAHGQPEDTKYVGESVNEARTVSKPIKVDNDTMVQIVGDDKGFRELTAALNPKTGKPIQKFGFDRGNETAKSKEELIKKLQKKYGKGFKFESVVNEGKFKQLEREIKILTGEVKIDFSEALESVQFNSILEAMEHLEIAIDRIKKVHKILKRKS